MSAALAGEEIHVSLSGVTRIYPGNAGTRPVHALGGGVGPRGACAAR